MPSGQVYSDRLTDETLEALESRIASTYRKASEEATETARKYFAEFVGRDAKQKALVEAGKLTEEAYQQWQLTQIARGKRYEALRDALAQRMTDANVVAMAYVNDVTPGIYALNYNYTAYTVEKLGGNLGFTLYDERTVRRLIADSPHLLPAPRVDIPLDLRWNQKQITAEITSGILQGDGIGKLADRLQSVTDMNRTAAIRNARTAVTGAQNAGKQESIDKATAAGMPSKKRWVCTKDSRTRSTHQDADGQTVPSDQPFIVGGEKLMHPGDMSGSPANLYNCRCTMRVEYEGTEGKEARKMRVRDPSTGRNVVVGEMTYAEWQRWVKDRGS